MTVYMLRRISTGLYFKKSVGRHLAWVKQSEGEIYRRVSGTTSAVTKARSLGVPSLDLETVPFVMTEAQGKDVLVLPSEGITIVSADDWQGIYLGGKLLREDHSLEGDDMLSALRIPYEYKEADNSWLEARGRLPENLSDVEFADG